MEVSPKYRNDPSCYSLWSQISQRWLSLKISLNIARGASIKGHADFITCLQFVAVCAHHGIHPGRTILSLTCSRCVFFLRVGGARVPRGRLGARIWSLCCRPSSKRRLKAILYAICHLPCLGSWIVWGGKMGKTYTGCTGWCFGTWLDYFLPYLGNVMIPIDSYFSEG